MLRIDNFWEDNLLVVVPYPDRALQYIIVSKSVDRRIHIEIENVSLKLFVALRRSFERHCAKTEDGKK